LTAELGFLKGSGKLLKEILFFDTQKYKKTLETLNLLNCSLLAIIIRIHSKD
jgi:hypothetical protein